MVIHYLEFLRKAHEIIQPRGYLEIGVRSGDSLRLAQCPAIGVDPNPAPFSLQPNHSLSVATSDEFFDRGLSLALTSGEFQVDFAFIDGMHLVENALRDFTNIEKYSNGRTIVAFDDVLPYNQAIASREQPPGDWTGDVWKIYKILKDVRPDLALILVDTSPTGMLFVTNLDRNSTTLNSCINDLEETVPGDILERTDAWPAEEALKQFAFWRELDESRNAG